MRLFSDCFERSRNKRVVIYMSADLTDLYENEISKKWHARSSRILQGLYDDDREGWRQRNARVSAHIAGLVYFIFAFTDYILVRDVFTENLTARFIIGAIYIIGIEFLYRYNARSIITESYCALATLLAYISWLLISSRSLEFNNMSYYIMFGIIFMLGQNVFFKCRFSIAASSSLTVLVIALVDVGIYRYIDFAYFSVVSSLFISTFVLTLFVNANLNKERYLVFLNSARAEIRRSQAIERGEALLRLSTTDALTGLANRRAVDDELRAYWREWQAHETSFSVILVDVDFFKLYNDCYGHQEGDKCLVAVADAMAKAAAKNGYMVGRFGGEEFILVAPTRDREHVREIAELIRGAVESLNIPHEQRPDGSSLVTVSVGAAITQNDPGTRVERLITEADRALYEAKRNNRNCISVFDHDNPNKIDSDENVAETLRLAISNNLINMVYQPVVAANSGEIVGAEALMRLRTLSGKAVSPAVFIPMSERMGIIGKLGEWAIRAACREILADGKIRLVSVNVSPIQLKAPNFPSKVADILKEYSIEPSRLAIEITESTPIEGQTEILQSIRGLKMLGVELWLDDFGTGFAGLSSVREIQFDYIKIDRSFLHATVTHKGNKLFESIVQLVRESGCKVIAEGIESEHQRTLCISHGIDLLQGFHLGRPISAELFNSLISRAESVVRQ